MESEGNGTTLMNQGAYKFKRFDEMQAANDSIKIEDAAAEEGLSSGKESERRMEEILKGKLQQAKSLVKGDDG